MKYYTPFQVHQLTKKSMNSVMRWIHGQNERGIKLKTIKEGRKYKISEKDLKDFVLKWWNLGD